MMSSNNDETDVLLSSRSNIYVPNHFEYGEMMSASIYPFSLNHFSAGFHSVDFVMMSQLMPDDTVFFYKSRPKEGEVSSHFLRRKYREKLNFHFPCSSGSTLHGVEPLFILFLRVCGGISFQEHGLTNDSSINILSNPGVFYRGLEFFLSAAIFLLGIL